jgi:hypothetical protein
MQAIAERGQEGSVLFWRVVRVTAGEKTVGGVGHVEHRRKVVGNFEAMG